MKQLTLREIQLKQLELLVETVRLCNKYDIPYYLIGGTLIGAVRHKGFIPWDDDIDVAIPRPSYERFIKIARTELDKKYILEHYSTTEGYGEYLLHITDPNVIISVNKVKNIESGVYIDILPIDGIPSEPVRLFFYKLQILKFRALAGLVNIDSIRDKERTGIEKLIIAFGKMTRIGKLLNLKKIRKKTDEYVQQFSFDECEKVGTIFGNYGFHEIVPKDFFGKGVEVTFEGKKFIGPSRTHEYLQHMYGDYMSPPPESERIGHHVNEKVITDVSGKNDEL
ncbi:MAG: LicD family protein [Lachnospiraceae bacterium]|nr:LicD family protein [Lachnospiraceae bacterium]